MSGTKKADRDQAGRTLIGRILDLMAARGYPDAEAVFRARPAGFRWRWWEKRTAIVMSGWRIGHYSYPVSWHTKSGQPYRADMVYPVYLLVDGRIVGDACHNLQADGTVSEHRNEWGKRDGRPPWCAPVKDHGDFFEVEPGAYLAQLAEFYRKAAPAPG
jgi:hypothetical protein